MVVAIIDADLIGRQKHRFPNLVCEKISAYYKEKGAEVHLKLDYENLSNYDEVFISKVFTDTPVPDWIANAVNMDLGEVNLPGNIHVGGTGFFFDHAPNLPDEIEHHMPDYHLYDEWIASKIETAKKEAIDTNKPFNEKSFMVQFKGYTDYSIGFTTRGCFRKCPFCVNKKYNKVFCHSPLNEFYDSTRKKICLLDDNILGSPKWKEIIQMLIDTGKPFMYKQGMDERLLTDEKCELLFSAKYDGDYIFAFDNIADYDLIQHKLQMIRRYTSSVNIKFYVLVGFESTDLNDIVNMWKRIELLMKYNCLPYIMRFQDKNEVPWMNSEFKGLYTAVARWCNQPSFFKKMSFREFCTADQKLYQKVCSSMKALLDFENKYPNIAKQYFDIKFTNYDISNLKEVC